MATKDTPSDVAQGRPRGGRRRTHPSEALDVGPELRSVRGLVRARELCESGLAGLDGKIVPDAADLVLVYKKRTTRLARRGARQMDRECILRTCDDVHVQALPVDPLVSIWGVE